MWPTCINVIFINWKLKICGYLPCMIPPARWSPEPASAPARCCSQRSTASPSSCEPSQSPQNGWRRNPSTTTTAPRNKEIAESWSESFILSSDLGRSLWYVSLNRNWYFQTLDYFFLKDDDAHFPFLKSLNTPADFSSQQFNENANLTPSFLMTSRLFLTRTVCYDWLDHLDEVAGDVPACDVQASCQVRQAEALVHWTDVCHTVTRVHHHTGQKA